jgi:hypothetical protein
MGILGFLFGGGNSGPAPEAKMCKDGDLVISLDPDSKQIIFAVLENKKIAPIIFDLKTRLITGCHFPEPEPDPTEQPAPAPPSL